MAAALEDMGCTRIFFKQAAEVQPVYRRADGSAVCEACAGTCCADAALTAGGVPRAFECSCSGPPAMGCLFEARFAEGVAAAEVGALRQRLLQGKAAAVREGTDAVVAQLRAAAGFDALLQSLCAEATAQHIDAAVEASAMAAAAVHLSGGAGAQSLPYRVVAAEPRRCHNCHRPMEPQPQQVQCLGGPSTPCSIAETLRCPMKRGPGAQQQYNASASLCEEVAVMRPMHVPLDAVPDHPLQAAFAAASLLLALGTEARLAFGLRAVAATTPFDAVWVEYVAGGEWHAIDPVTRSPAAPAVAAKCDRVFGVSAEGYAEDRSAHYIGRHQPRAALDDGVLAAAVAQINDAVVQRMARGEFPAARLAALRAQLAAKEASALLHDRRQLAHVFAECNLAMDPPAIDDASTVDGFLRGNKAIDDATLDNDSLAPLRRYTGEVEAMQKFFGDRGSAPDERVEALLLRCSRQWPLGHMPVLLRAVGLYLHRTAAAAVPRLRVTEMVFVVVDAVAAAHIARPDATDSAKGLAGAAYVLCEAFAVVDTSVLSPADITALIDATEAVCSATKHVPAASRRLAAHTALTAVLAMVNSLVVLASSGDDITAAYASMARVVGAGLAFATASVFHPLVADIVRVMAEFTDFAAVLWTHVKGYAAQTANAIGGDLQEVFAEVRDAM
jgi:hypothetical protein